MVYTYGYSAVFKLKGAFLNLHFLSITFDFYVNFVVIQNGKNLSVCFNCFVINKEITLQWFKQYLACAYVWTTW